MQDMLHPIGLSDNLIGYLGLAVSVSSLCGGMIIGPISDQWFRRKLKKLLIILFFAAITSFAITFITIPSPWWTYGEPIEKLQGDGQRDSRFGIVLVCVVLIGFFSGGIVPVFFEIVAELSYPVSEGTSGMCLVFVNNIASLMIIGIGSWLNTKYETIVSLCILVVCLLVSISVKEVYKRDS
ncbi:hypothetical protein RFI_18691 [Reticulomyxa filosa]|uniref:Major facilitator superfamily (MFS) profile domain-containing protein n=1 Tax=Reticulomyxa filosa TaxID=46433 RepID=X6MXM2_RETFI|nr:hypothetical protein RFI_18691 [Reticulomyxa filosa]|eukprot:ETO18574.1 hypothetical protein RFI_18691 [Reticulomyxa filosa]